MSLTDTQIRDLARKMSIPLQDVCFKDELTAPLAFNKSYIINMEDATDEYGNENDGSHWVFLQVNKDANGKMEPIYFDPYGKPAPEHVKAVVEKTIGRKGLPYTEKDVQSLLNNACGFYCLALGHFINASKYRSNILYNDVNDFMEMFDDLNHSVDFKKNEYILKHFFRSEDPSLRKEIDIETITSHDTKGGIDAFKMPVDVKYIDK